MKQIDILVPCYNEEAVLPQFYERTCAVIDSLPDYAFTFIFVNDGSRDRTLPILRQLHEKDARVAYVSLSRNFGKEAAMLAGMDYAEGDALVIMDADLQDPPELLPDMIAWWEKGYRDVSARRRHREGETFFKKWSSHVYYRLLKKLSPVPVQEDVGDFRLLDKRCVKALCSLRECQRYTKGLFCWIGFEKKEILFDRPPRQDQVELLETLQPGHRRHYQLHDGALAHRRLRRLLLRLRRRHLPHLHCPAHPALRRRRPGLPFPHLPHPLHRRRPIHLHGHPRRIRRPHL